MTDIFLEIAGKVFGVPVDLTMQIYGAPFSIRLSTQGGINLNNAWNAISEKLYEYVGISLPDLSNGPWKALVGIGSNTEILPSLYIGPTKNGANGKSEKTSVNLELQIAPPIEIGGTDTYGPFTITLEPNITIHAIYLGYEDGLKLRLKISTPTTTGTKSNGVTLEPVPGPPKYQIVSYPFPLPPQKSSSTLFEFKYLGLGQKVGPNPVTNVDDPMNAIFDELETQFTATDPATVLKELATNFYHPDRNWFIAAHAVVVNWDIKILFNDPSMYGLRVSVPMSPPSPFMGLLFEILYQKLSPNLGVYYGAITLPYFLRRIPLYGVILILPGFSIWVYTNGDFRVNIGWPLGDSSVGIQVGVLIGIAGFYFGKLSSAANPGARPNVYYNPILIFGIGISVYVKQGFSVSVFSASIAVSVTATLQGLLAWRAGGASSGPPDHYWFAGTAGLSVLIQGTVDFSILKASVVISLQANIGIAFETGCMTVLAVSASVSVKVSVKVIFFTIRLSFSASISHQFTIGSGPRALVTGPVDPDLSGFITPSPTPAQIRARTLALRYREHMSVHRGPETAWRLGRTALATASPEIIDLYFVLQPTAVYSTEPASIQVIASLIMEAPDPGSASGNTAFELLVNALVSWLVENYSTPGQPWPERLVQVAQELGSGGEPPGPGFGGRAGFEAAIDDFLRRYVTFEIQGVDGNGSAPFSGPAAVLPMLDMLQLTYPVAGSPHEETIDFSTFNLTPLNYPDAVSVFFEELSWSSTGSSGPNRLALRAQAPKPSSMAGYLLHDYFLLLSRQVVNDLAESASGAAERAEINYLASMEASGSDPVSALDIAAEFTASIVSDDALGALLADYNYAGAAGLGSRYLLHGLQLPEPSQTPAHPTPANMRVVPTAGLYVLTGQQFAAEPGATSVSATLSWNQSTSRAISFGAAAGATSTISIPSAVPAPPSPEWHILQAPPAALPSSSIVVSPLAPLSPYPLYYSLKNQIAWTVADQSTPQTILTLPDPLIASLRRSQFLLALTSTEPQQHFRATARIRAAATDEIDSVPALLIRLSLAQVPAETVGAVGASGSPSTGSPANGSSPKYLPFVYQLGGTDQQTRDLIHDALQLDLSNASISLLYPTSSSNALVSEQLSSRVLLAKINLSTLNQVAAAGPVHLLRAMALAAPEYKEFAPITDVKNFLRLVWELSVVNAPGYFLFYESAAGQDLPADLFATQGVGGNSSQFEMLVSFGQPRPRPQLANAQNCVWIPQAMQPNTTLYGALLETSGKPVRRYSPTYPAGSVAFGIEWTRALAGSSSPIPVDDLYQLIQYAVLPEGGYFGSSWSLPAGPTEDDPNPLLELERSSSDWLYTLNLPISRFFGIPSPVEEDPYAMIGSDVTVGFRLDDLYGNPLPDTHTATALPLYNDPLVSIGEWPGVQVHYHIQPALGQAAGLVLTAVFDPDSLTPQVFSPSGSDASPAQQWQSVLDRYTLIRYQLQDPNTSVSVLCSLGAGPVGNPSRIVTDLLSFVDDVKQQVLIALENSLPNTVYNSIPEQVRRSLIVSLPFSSVRAWSSNIVQVGVSIVFVRDTNFIAPEVSSELPSVVSVMYSPNPDLQLDSASPSGSPGSGGLNAFAALFEAAFRGFDGAAGLLKLAETSGIQTSSNAGETAPLWAVRWSAQSGIAVTFNGERITYFALRPLNASLLTQTSTSTGLLYSNVDLDEWAYEFVQAADAFLSPKNAVAIAILDLLNKTDYFDQLMTAKESLADSIPEGLANLLQNQAAQGDLSEAHEQLRQALLKALSSAFSVSTIAQAPARVFAGGSQSAGSPGPEPPRLYGSVGPPLSGSPNAAPRQYTISSGELALHPGDNQMTVLVSVANATAQSELVLPLGYEVSYLQHGFGQEVDGYVPSSWIKFILAGFAPLAIPVTGVSDAHIPISLPFYPQLPNLKAQSASGVDLGSPYVVDSPSTVENEIADVLRWQYVAHVEHTWAAQDQLFITATFNRPLKAPFPLRFGAPQESLFDALAWFRQQYASISGELGLIAQEAYPGAVSSSPGRALDVIQTFTEAMQRVANAWKNHWKPSFGARASLPSEVITEYFYLQQSGSTLELYGKTASGGNPAYWPIITLQASGESWSPQRSQAQGPTEPGGFWSLHHTFAAGANLSSLIMTWQPLDVLERQTATLSAYVLRNADLVGSSEPVNPAFIYKTAEVEFPGAIVPLIQRGAIAPLQPEATLAATLIGILTPMARLGSSMNPYLRINASYEFNLALPAGGGPGLSSSIAIMLADGIQLSGSGSVESVSRQLANELAEWYIRMQPSTTNAVLVLGLSVFGSVADEQLPLVQIARIPVVIKPDFSWWLG